MATRLTLRIQEKNARLTKTERKLAALLLENQALIDTHSATELAALSGVSKATTARFFRNLGYQARYHSALVRASRRRDLGEPSPERGDRVEFVVPVVNR